MKHQRQILTETISVILFAVLGYGALAILNDLFSIAGKWEGKVRSALPSVDGWYVAEVSDWNGGATTGFETRVALRQRSARDTVTGVTRSKGTVAVLLGSPPVSARWLGPQQLAIENPDSNFKERQESWRDVQIIYCKTEGPLRAGRQHEERSDGAIRSTDSNHRAKRSGLPDIVRDCHTPLRFVRNDSAGRKAPGCL